MWRCRGLHVLRVLTSVLMMVVSAGRKGREIWQTYSLHLFTSLSLVFTSLSLVFQVQFYTRSWQCMLSG